MSIINKKLVFLRTSISWFGLHSGYEQITRHFANNINTCIISPLPKFSARIKGKAISIWRGYGNAPQTNIEALWRFEKEILRDPESVGHILYGEDFLRFAPRMAKEVMERTVFTFHQPPSQWKPESLLLLKFVKNAVFLYKKDINFFSKYLNTIPNCILYGVDTDYFSPSVQGAQLRILYSGVHLRNLNMLLEVVNRLNNIYPNLAFDFLVPTSHRTKPEFQILNNLKNVIWHAGLSDEKLRLLYQDSYLLLLPMNDSGANTAITEALASGLPIVTTDVGGVRDYGGGNIFPIIENNDVQGMVDLINKYICDRNYRDKMAELSRDFATSNISWSDIANQHLKFYNSI